MSLELLGNIKGLAPKQRQDLESFLSQMPSIGLDPADWRRSGTLRSELAGKGIVASMIDSHIACCALTIHGFLLSRDKIFQKMAKVIGLQLIE
jgi:predicted nucleic acid-binding protein